VIIVANNDRRSELEATVHSQLDRASRGGIDRGIGSNGNVEKQQPLLDTQSPKTLGTGSIEVAGEPTQKLS
jgi:hypothetical protein